MPVANGQLTNVGVHPTVRPYLDLLFPIPTGQDFGDGTAEQALAYQDPTDEHFGVVKFDYNMKSGNFMVRWSSDLSNTIDFASASAVLRAHHNRYPLPDGPVPARVHVDRC